MSKTIDFLSLPDVDTLTDTFELPRLGELSIKAIKEQTLQECRKRAKSGIEEDGTLTNDGKLNVYIVAAGLTKPVLYDSDFLAKAGCENVTEFITDKLTPGEIADISAHILHLSGFNMGINKKIDEAKN